MTPVMVFGAFRRSGISKSSKESYDMCKVHYGVGIRPISRENMTFMGAGYEPREAELSPAALSQFDEYAKDLPCMLLLNIEAKEGDINRNWVTGVHGVAE